MKRNALITAALLALSGLPLQAQDVLETDPTLPTTRIGTRGGAFFALGVGARAQALGGAYTALADDISALYWNTAGITRLDGFSAGLHASSLYGDLDITHTFVGAVMPLGLGRVGVSVNILDSGSMLWADELYPNPGQGENDFNPIRSEFSWQSLSIGGHYARPVTDRLAFGGALKFIQEGISGAQASFVAADLGTQFETGLYGLTLGASLLNLGTGGAMEGKELTPRVNTGNSESQVGGWVRVVDARLGTTEVELPTAFRFSVMADLVGSASSVVSTNPDNSLRLVWDLTDAVDTDLQTAVGVEYGYRDIAFLRMGKLWSNEAQISYDFARGASIGGGVNIPMGSFGSARLDYAYTSMAELENVQVLGLEVHF